MLLEDAVRAAPFVRAEEGPVVDVGSGSGSPGVPLAVLLPDRPFTLLEAERRKCEFLGRVTADLSNVEVVWGRAEERPPETEGVALAKALARPPVAAELCLPLVRLGGAAILWVGETADLEHVVTRRGRARREAGIGGGGSGRPQEGRADAAALPAAPRDGEEAPPSLGVDPERLVGEARM